MKTDLEARKTWPLCSTSSTPTGYTGYPITSDVAVFQKEAQHAVVSKSSAEFKEWCHKSLAKGAAGAHAFLREADEPPQINVTFNNTR